MSESSAALDNILNLDREENAMIMAELCRKDAKLRKAIESVGPFSIEKRKERSIFGALVRSIIYQQLNGRAAATIYGRFTDSFSKKSCPSAASIYEATDEALRECGISRPKLNAIRALCSHQLEGSLPTEKEALLMSDEELIEALTRVKGVGLWTAQMLLIFHLGRPDVLPYTDYGVKKGFQRVFHPKETDELTDLQERLIKRAKLWRPYRSVASWYMWRVLD
ncbi:MAG: DNA-3-methyladenine glycosylase 2 family protein [Candidatus Obscuribacterales bacterium]|nr:DNA-3-methyladenine glycosylase 2 family protein [Cyanobacteria bacterium HKST-UBA01]MCB9471368.1 DNA-3-methyladenine glycosylase 2 family protein [Candidatus Obscuribacterales bacterium]